MRDEGLLKSFLWFVAASYGLAIVEYAVSPGIVDRWAPSWLGSVNDGIWRLLLVLVSVVWLSVVVTGTMKFGRPAVLLWLPVVFGLWFPIMWGRVIVGCGAYHECP